jgi:hypothetical protein
MKNLRGIIVLLALAVSASSYANVVGVSAHPFALKNKFVTTEITGNFSANSGMGVQARYFQKINSNINVDAGFGFAGGNRSSRILLGADYLLYPDYKRQPRISVKATFEKLKEAKINRDAMGLTPIISKGFAINKHEVFPFLAIPMKLSLDSESKKYKTVSSLAFGVTGRVPLKGYKHITGNIEANLNIDKSYSGLFMGVALPLN